MKVICKLVVEFDNNALFSDKDSRVSVTMTNWQTRHIATGMAKNSQLSSFSCTPSIRSVYFEDGFIIPRGQIRVQEGESDHLYFRPFVGYYSYYAAALRRANRCIHQRTCWNKVKRALSRRREIEKPS
jgi:hypothetical protein